MKDIIEKILSIAVLAPSGDNAQPWRFVIRRNEIHIFNISDRDLTLYNFRQRGAYLAHGAVIENIALAASDAGCRAGITLFPDDSDSNHVAIVALENEAIKKDPLFAYIAERSTNRKPYRAEPLLKSEKSDILSASGDIGCGEIRLVEDRAKINFLAEAISLNERLILENRYIHDVLFTHIVWTEEEARERRAGMYVKTLELKPPEKVALKLFRNWSLLKVLNKLGASRLLPKQSARLYASSGAIGAIIMPDDSKRGYVMAGRVFQRMWLKATKAGLCVSPITVVAYLGKRIADGDTSEMPGEHVELIKEAYKKIIDSFGVSTEVIAMVFRIGHGGRPSATSFKLPPDIRSENW